MKKPDQPGAASRGKVSIARALSKLGHCSRAQGERLVADGHVRVNGTVVREISFRVTPETDRIEVDGKAIEKQGHVYLALNKPRGLVTTRDDPQNRATVYDCLTDESLPFVGPVGRLDKASEGLLLLTNDTRWADRLTDPATHVDKTYHVQVRGDGFDAAVTRIAGGITEQSTGELLTVKKISVLRVGSRSTAWFEVVLDEGRNRQLRRIFTEVGLEVVRLVRIAIGTLSLGDLAKGEWRHLSAAEVQALIPPGARPARARSR